MSTQTESPEVYPRAPLVEVVFEIRFPGEPAVECRRDELFEFIRREFPKVRVPEASAQDHFKFRTYQYASDDGAFTVMSGLNTLVYSSKRYTGFAEFKKQLTPIFTFFIERFKLHALRRFGFRYINAIPFSRENGSIPLSKFFKSQLAVSPEIPTELEQCAFMLVQKSGEGHVITRVEGLKHQKAEEEAILLDIDYFREGGLEASKIGEYLEVSHSGAKYFFENIITDQYREFLRGKPLV